MQDLLQGYNLIVLLNLLSKDKPQEDQLSIKTKQLLEKFQYQQVKPFHFDFH
jgi:hypothetical protein